MEFSHFVLTMVTTYFFDEQSAQNQEPDIPLSTYVAGCSEWLQI